jgi:hypothetical protein
VEMHKVTDSLCGENSRSDLAAIMLGAFTKLRKATGSYAMSVRPHEITLKPIFVKFYTRCVTLTPVMTTHDLSKSDKHDLQST